MAKKLGNGGHSQENYDPETGKYVASETSGANKNTDGKKEFDHINLDEIRKSNNISLDLGEFDDLDLDKFFNDPAYADILNMDIDTNLRLEDLYKKFKSPIHPTVWIKTRNPHFNEAPRYRMNCQRCVAVCEMSFRGYDVTAAAYRNRKTYMYNPTKGHDYYAINNNYTLFFSATPDDQISIAGQSNEEVYDKISKLYEKDGDNARYVFSLTRSKKDGHVFNIAKLGGEISVCDIQPGRMCRGKEEVINYLNEQKNLPSESLLLRVDNRELSIEDIQYAVEVEKKKKKGK